MNTRWMYGLIFAALVVSAVLPTITLAWPDPCFDCMNQCDEDHRLCLYYCEGLEPDLYVECRFNCHQELFRCDQLCRYTVCRRL